MTVSACLQRLQALPQLHVALRPPASEAAIQSLEAAWQRQLPPELREFYQLSDGIEEHVEINEKVQSIGYLFLPVGEALTEYQRREDTPQRRFLLAIAPTHEGGWFGYRIDVRRIISPAIYAWSPIEDELTEIAAGLSDFLLGWANGTISV